MACLSHDTALAAWDISDIDPDRVHITVGRDRRIRRTGGEQYVVHYEDLDATQVTWWQGVRTVDVPTYLISQALDRAGRTSHLPAAERERLTRDLERRDGGE